MHNSFFNRLSRYTRQYVESFTTQWHNTLIVYTRMLYKLIYKFQFEQWESSQWYIEVIANVSFNKWTESTLEASIKAIGSPVLQIFEVC